jgi:hypothetical protein
LSQLLQFGNKADAVRQGHVPYIAFLENSLSTATTTTTTTTAASVSMNTNLSKKTVALKPSLQVQVCVWGAASVLLRLVVLVV